MSAPAPLRASDRTFGRRTVIVMAAAGVVSLLAMMFVPILQDDGSPAEATRGANAWSKSAIGHHALVTVLERLDVGVLVSRHRSEDKVGPERALWVAEPHTYEDDDLERIISTALGNQAAVVLTLPQWEIGFWEEPPPDGAPAMIPEADVAALIETFRAGLARHQGLDVATGDVEVVRGPLAAPAWVSAFEVGQGPRLPQPQTLTDGLAGFEPVLWDSATGRALIVRSDDAPLYVIADPGLFNTMGLGLGDNAVTLYRFLTEHVGATGVVVDEVLHGFKRASSIWRELFSFPLLLLSLHVLGLLALVLWATIARFGKPQTPPPRVPPGKRTLIENTATLLTLGGHVGRSVREYAAAVVRSVSQAYALPQGMQAEARLLRLAALAEERGVSEDIVGLVAHAERIRNTRRERRAAVQLAGRLSRFREEMMHGHRGH